jgi:hypothetical protein
MIAWVVRNEDTEAENINDLGHYSGSGYYARDKSAFAGTFYMDWVLRHSDRVLVVRRVPVTITGPHRGETEEATENVRLPGKG